FAARKAEAAARGRLRGIGCAVFIEPAGGGVPSDEAAITFAADGTVLLHVVAIASGQGHETVLPEIAARALGIDPLRVTLRARRQDGPVLKGAAAFGSRTTMSQGSVSAEAAKLVIRKGTALAAQALEAAEADIAYAAGAFRIAGTDRAITLEALAQRFPGGPDSTAALPATITFPSGAPVAAAPLPPPPR